MARRRRAQRRFLAPDPRHGSAEVSKFINRHKLVVRSVPFDVYSGEGIPRGKKSVAYRIVFQSDQGTLTSEQVDGFQGDILRQLQRALGAELRG